MNKQISTTMGILIHKTGLSPDTIRYGADAVHFPEHIFSNHNPEFARVFVLCYNELVKVN